MIAQVWKSKCFGNQIAKQNPWENTCNMIEMKSKAISQNPIFLWFFQNPWKQIRWIFWSSKTLLNTCLKILENSQIFLLKNLSQNPKEMGYIKPPSKTSRWGCLSALAAGGRPARSTANGQKIDRWSIGRPSRSTAAWNREQTSLPVDRPGRPGLSRQQKLSGGRPGRSTEPPARLACTFCARRSTDSVDRLLARSTGPVDRQKPEIGFSGFKNLVLYLK